MERQRILLAVLASPPTTSGTRTITKVREAATLLGCDAIRVENLCSLPANNLRALTATAVNSGPWLDARAGLTAGLQTADLVLAGWGLDCLSGPARLRRAEQLAWVRSKSIQQGRERFWTIGGQPRHPSRWHQYVSDVHGRTSGGTFSERLAQVAVLVPIQELVGD